MPQAISRSGGAAPPRCSEGGQEDRRRASPGDIEQSIAVSNVHDSRTDSHRPEYRAVLRSDAWLVSL